MRQSALRTHAMASSRKKAIVRTAEGLALAGYLPPTGFMTAVDVGEMVELLDLEGRLATVPLAEVRMIAFVRDFNLGEAEPERMLRKTFPSRPRSEGLWVRVRFRDGEVLEGLAALDVGLLDDIVRDHGLHLMPPDTRGNTQRVFVPRSAMAALEILGVVTTPSRTAQGGKRKGAGEVESGELPFPQG